MLIELQFVVNLMCEIVQSTYLRSDDLIAFLDGLFCLGTAKVSG